MRNLKTSDLFALGRCITKIGIKDEIKNIAKEADSVKDVWDRGFDLVYTLFEKVCESGSEKPIYEFIGTILECGWEDVRDMSPVELIGKLKEVADWKQWQAFFKTAVR